MKTASERNQRSFHLVRQKLGKTGSISRLTANRNFMNHSTLRIQNDIQAPLDSCLQCLVACELCVAACLDQENSEAMNRCIQFCRICADLCALTAREIARKSILMRQVCALCVLACWSCGEECARHSHVDPCKRCAAACRRCEKECQKVATGSSKTPDNLQAVAGVASFAPLTIEA